MLLLAAYRNGERKNRSKTKTRVPQWLPEPHWFRNQLQACKLENSLSELSSSEARQRTVVSSQGLQLQAIVTLKPGVQWQGSLTPFTEEARLLWEYYNKPCSAYSVEVDKFFHFKQPCKILQRAAGAKNRPATAPVTLQHFCFLPSVRALTEELLFRERGCDEELTLDLLCERLGSRFADALERCHWTIPVLLVPKPIMLLMEMRQWKSLLLRLMGPIPGRDIPDFQKDCLTWLRNVMDYPSREELNLLFSNRFQTWAPPEQPLTADSAMFVLQQLRLHAADIIASGGVRSQEKLEQALEGLELFCQTLGFSRTAGSHVGNRKAPASRIILDICSARFLRNRSDLKNMKNAIVQSLVPSHMHAFAKALMYNPLSASSLSKFQVLSCIMFLINHFDM